METENKINETSEFYRPVGARGSLLFFILMDLCGFTWYDRFSKEHLCYAYIFHLHGCKQIRTGQASLLPRPAIVIIYASLVLHPSKPPSAESDY